MKLKLPKWFSAKIEVQVAEGTHVNKYASKILELFNLDLVDKMLADKDRIEAALTCEHVAARML